MADRPTYDELEQRVRELEAAQYKRRRMRDAAIDSENPYRILFENMLNEVHVWELIRDESGNIKTWKLVDANPKALQSWNRSLAEVVGKTADEIFPKSNPTELFLPIVNQIVAGGTPHTWESYIPDTDQFLHMVSIPFGEYFISTGLDITKIKQNEEAFRRKNEMLARTESIANIGSWEWDIEPDRVTWSEELYHIFGLDPSGDAPTFAEHQEIYVTEDMRRLKDAAEACINQGTPYELELRAIRSDGQMRHCLARGQAEIDKNKKIIRLVGSLQDITDRKQIENALRDSEERYKLMFDNAPVGYQSLDKDGCILDVNRTWLDHLGYQHDEVIGQWFGDFLHDDQKEIFRKLFPVNIQSTEPIFGVQFTLKRKDGTHLLAEYTARIGRDVAGEFVRTHCVFQDITERKRAENAMHEAELRRQEAIRAGNVGLWDWDLTTDRVNYSEEWKRQIGYEDHEISNDFEEWRSRVHPDDLEATLEKVNKSIKDLNPYHMTEFRFMHRDGSYRWILAQASIIQDETGRLVRMLGSHVDITERKKTERELLMLKTAIDQAPIGIALADQDINIYYCNPEGLNMRGGNIEKLVEIPEDAFTNWQVYKLNGEPYGTHELPLVRAIKNGNMIRELFIVKHEDDIDHICDAIACPVIRDEKIIGGLIIFLDITERQKYAEVLRASEQRYRELFDSINDLVYTQDLQGRFLSLNPSLARILGYEPEELVGVKTSQLMEPKFRKFFDTEYLGGLKREGNHQGTSKYLTKDGGARYLEYNSSLVTTAEGEQYISGIGRDVTERIKAQKQMEALQKQLRQTQKMEAVGTLAGGIAHNFNNILAAIQGYAEIALEEGARGRTNLHEIENILEASDRAKSLVRRILSFSRGDQPQFKAMEINKAVIPAINLLQQTLPKMINLQIELAEKPDLVNLDPYDIEQVIINLGTNARDAMPEGGTLTVSTSQSTVENMTCLVCPEPFSGGYAVITVADNGQGISQEELERIFDPFFTTKEVDKGTGLGLSTVFGIVRSHNGHITCETEPGKGTTFQIYLPINDAEPDVSDEEVPAEKIKGGQETILLVDDEEQILEIGAQQLSGSGYNVLTAHNGEEALEVFKAKRDEIAVVILDLSMPVMGGHKCLQELLLLSPEIKVIISTGYSLAGDIGEAMSSGAAALLSKPFSKHEMLKTVRMVLDA